MTAERDQSEPDRSQTDPENILHLKNELLSLWEQLPGEHKAMIALVVLDEMQQSEWGEWLTEAVVEFTRAREQEPIAQTTGRFLLERRDFVSKQPLEVYQVAPDLDSESDKADFSQWMEAVDQSVWMIAGCSVHDLPDCNFRSMFNDGASPAEMANEALQEAGFNLFE